MLLVRNGRKRNVLGHGHDQAAAVVEAKDPLYEPFPEAPVSGHQGPAIVVQPPCKHFGRRRRAPVLPHLI
jgi:hypothetical protein